MVTPSHRDLRVWQRAHAVRVLMLQVARRARVRIDEAFCRRLQEAAHDTCRSIVSGFEQQDDEAFARYMVSTVGSLNELIDLLDEALANDYISREEYVALEQQVQVAIRSAAAYRAVLVRTARTGVAPT